MSGISFFGDGFCKNLRSKTKYLVAAAGLAAAMNLGVQINTAEAAHLENNKIQNAVVSVSPGPGNFVGSDYFNSETAKLMVSKYTPTVISTLSKTSGISVDQIKTAYENMHRDSDEYIAKYGGGARFRSKLETLYSKGKSMDSIREEVSGVLANNSPFFVGGKTKEDALRFTNNVCDRVEEKEKVKVRETTLDRSKVNSTELQGNKPQGKNSEGISM